MTRIALHGKAFVVEDLSGEQHTMWVLPFNRLNGERRSSYSLHAQHWNYQMKKLFELQKFTVEPGGEKLEIPITPDHYSREEINEIEDAAREAYLGLYWAARAVIHDPSQKDGYPPPALLELVPDEDLIRIVAESRKEGERYANPTDSPASATSG